MTRAIGAAVMMMLGGACLRLVVGGGYVDYVKDLMYWPLLLSGVVLSVLGAVGLLRETSPGRAALASAGHAGHGHGHGEPRVAWLLLVPVLAVYVVPPPALGADSIDRSSARVAEPLSPYGPLPEDGPVALTVREFVERAVYDTSGALEDREVVLTGFAVPAGEAAQGGPSAEEVPVGGADAAFTLARVSMFCCAADGYAFTVDVTGTDTAPAPDTWLEVRGTLVPIEGEPDPYTVPVLDASSVTVVERPANVYE
ncbi:DUF1980 domain-containing protein [Aquipuribacter sp. SD81]|uniref:DUF1980 domain-containing protein n=1 Tax=Aquipuribacter sp. SD81 TaxID=3127703 RepID=UPI0030162A90